jgi:hypothetical protein
MSQEIINVLDYMCDKLGIAVDWTAENVLPQVMEILSRYRLYEIVSKSVSILAMVLIVIIFAVIVKKAIKKNGNDLDEFLWWLWDSIIGWLVCIFGIAIVVTIVICIPANLDELFKWIFIPEVQILDLLQGYVK